MQQVARFAKSTEIFIFCDNTATLKFTAKIRKYKDKQLKVINQRQERKNYLRLGLQRRVVLLEQKQTKYNKVLIPRS